MDRVRARFARAARDRSGVEGREAGRHRRLRHAAVRRLARRRLVARLALHRVPDGGREDVSERRHRAGTAGSAAQRTARGRQLPREHQRGLAWRGVRTARISRSHRPAHRARQTSSAIDLLPRTPKFREDQFRDLFKEEQPKTPASRAAPSRPTRPHPAHPTSPAAAAGRGRPVEIVFDDIRRRASVLPVGVDVARQEISPDGKWLLLTARAAGQQNLYVYPLDELSREPAVARQLTSTPGAEAQRALHARQQGGLLPRSRARVQRHARAARAAGGCASRAELDVDFSREKIEAFRQAWTLPARPVLRREDERRRLGRGARRVYEPRVAGARTPDEMRRVMSLMLGELNASHMGISAPAAGRAEHARTPGASTSIAPSTSRTAGCASRGHRRSARRRSAGHQDRATTSCRSTARRSAARSNLDELLDHTIGKRVALSVAASPTAPPRDVVVKPIDQPTEKGLRYRQWVEQKRAYVAKASGGRLGYVHMFDMSAGRAVAAARSISTPRTTRGRASSSTCATTTAASSTSTRSTCSRGAATST